MVDNTPSVSRGTEDAPIISIRSFVREDKFLRYRATRFSEMGFPLEARRDNFSRVPFPPSYMPRNSII